MSDIAIRVENLSKAYRIGLAEQRHETLLGAMASFVRSPWENYRNLRKLSRFDDVSADARNQKSEIRNQKSANRPSDAPFQLSAFNSQLSAPADVIWALKDVSFEVKHGEVLGIIGRNGAGKSTLLKILSRITEPTSGRAEVYGRVGSLLEVGTGFHPDLTGRENIYLNGTILGMKKREIDRRFDEIVDFSGVEKFIDTPVKRYSSGMRVRLAFSVAAHLEPEILIIDEVLAVGDTEFQKKCLGKMQDVASQGRTVLFVSHSMHTVRRLCQRVILMDGGRRAIDGVASAVVDEYLNKTDGDIVGGSVRDVAKECRDKAAYSTHWRLRDSAYGPYSAVSKGQVGIILGVKVIEPLKGAFLGIAIWAEDGTLVWAANSRDRDGTSHNLSSGEYEAVFLLDELPVRPGSYNLETSVNSVTGQLDHWYARPALTVRRSDTTLLPDRWKGLVDAQHLFSLIQR